MNKSGLHASNSTECKSETVLNETVHPSPFKRTLHFLGGTAAVIISFWLLLTLVYCVPQEWMVENLQESIDILETEGLYPESYVGENKFDNFTVALMLNMASCVEDNPFVGSLESNYVSDGSDQIENLRFAVEGSSEELVSYANYWHGYLLFLKPMLVFLNVAQIRLVLQSVMLVLVGVACACFSRKLGSSGVALSVALCASLGFFGCADASATLPIFASFAIAVSSTIWASCVQLNSKWQLFCGFALIGALTVYFDFLDNPVLTLGMPLCILALRCYQNVNLKGCALLFLACCLGWFVGYGGIWASKWLLATVVTGSDVISSAIASAAFRTGTSSKSQDYGFTPASAVLNNFSQAGFVRYAILGLLVLLIAAIFVLAVRPTSRPKICMLLPSLVFLLVTAAIPYVWYVVLSNHSSIHAFFTFRNQIITMMCLLVANWLAIRGQSTSDMPNQQRKASSDKATMR